MRTLAFSLLALAVSSAISFAGDVVVTGILKQETHAETKAEYFLIESDKPVSKGSEKTSKLQLAGLDQKAWSNASKLIGKKVSAKGELMEAHTRYHFTDLLLLTDQVSPAK